jgi:hypothetical protein
MEVLRELIKESWENACRNGYESELLALSLEHRVDDIMDCDAIVAEYPRVNVLKIMEEMFNDYTTRTN